MAHAYRFSQTFNQIPLMTIVSSLILLALFAAVSQAATLTEKDFDSIAKSFDQTHPSGKVRKFDNVGSERRVLSTNSLNGFRKDFPSIWPPGLGGQDAGERAILDIGANNGDTYTLPGYQQGHTVFAFEPSPMVNTLFRGVMRKNNVSVALVKMRKNEFDKSTLPAPVRKVKIPSGSSRRPKVYLLPIALSNYSGFAKFHESPCRDLEKCGKVNHIITSPAKVSRVSVPTYRLDDLSLPVSKNKVWLFKIDVEGHELEVLQGSRKFLREKQVPYIAVEFSNNGRTGIEWGVDLLEEMHSQGYDCYHLRGFGRCHDSRYKSPSLKCNYPFSTADELKAPTFEEYTQVFAVQTGKENEKRRMADLMCVRRKNSSTEGFSPGKEKLPPGLQERIRMALKE